MKTTNHKTTKLFKGTYLFTGINFSIEINNDEGYWAIEETTLKVYGNEDVREDIEFYTFTTKSELIGLLIDIDNR